MSAATRGRLSWTLAAPVAGLLVLAASWGRHPSPVVATVIAVFLIGAVLAAVHHAEVVAHRVGEPFGSLVLAVAVTVIEVGLILTLMLSGGPETYSLARDTVFAAVMITTNGILGLSLLVGAVKHHLVVFNAEGTGAALATVAMLATMTMVLPSFTSSVPGPEFSSAQLTFAALASLVLYGVFVATQTVRHRDFFLPVDDEGGVIDESSGEHHAARPSSRTTLLSLGLLVAALIAVVGELEVAETRVW